MLKRRPEWIGKSIIALIAGILLTGFGIVQWLDDSRVLRSAVEVTGHFTGTHEARNNLAADLPGATTLHPHVSFRPPGEGAEQVLVLEDNLPAEDFASRTERPFLYVPGTAPELRLPERLSFWGGPVVWWSLVIGIVTIFAALAEWRRRTA